MQRRAIARPLQRAQTALAEGRLRPATREAWRAGQAAALSGDETSLQGVQAIAIEIAQHGEGRRRTEALQLVTYCTACLDQLASGLRPPSTLDRLLGRGWTQPKDTARKTCPECAEQVKAAARVCRFCGHRFDAEG